MKCQRTRHYQAFTLQWPARNANGENRMGHDVLAQQITSQGLEFVHTSQIEHIPGSDTFSLVQGRHAEVAFTQGE